MSEYYCSEHGAIIDSRCSACEGALEWARKDQTIAAQQARIEALTKALEVRGSGMCRYDYEQRSDCASRTTGANPMSSDKWIACSERLPEEGQVVVLLDTSRYVAEERSIEHVMHIGCYRSWSGGYWSVTGERGFVLDAFTYWMDLPAPPATGSEK